MNRYECQSDTPASTFASWPSEPATCVSFHTCGLIFLVGYIPDRKRWIIAKCNPNHRLCKHYPETLIVPKGVTTDMLESLATPYAQQKFPVFIWGDFLKSQAILLNGSRELEFCHAACMYSPQLPAKAQPLLLCLPLVEAYTIPVPPFLPRPKGHFFSTLSILTTCSSQ